MSLSRRTFLALGGLAGGLAILPALSAQEVADLKTQLTSVLRARRANEFAFINLVVEKVNSGALPRPVVNAAFNYARGRQPYPYPYFEETMKRLARQVGVDLGPPSSGTP